MAVFPLILSHYDVADTVEFVAATGDKVEVDFVVSVYAS